MEISFVVDASASIWPDNFTLGLNFIEDFVGLFDISPSAVSWDVIFYIFYYLILLRQKSHNAFLAKAV